MSSDKSIKLTNKQTNDTKCNSVKYHPKAKTIGPIGFTNLCWKCNDAFNSSVRSAIYLVGFMCTRMLAALLYSIHICEMKFNEMKFKMRKLGRKNRKNRKFVYWSNVKICNKHTHLHRTAHGSFRINLR